MIPILYKPGETDFSTHGLGMLSDASECTVSEQINDAYELSLSYPVDGIHFRDIGYGCLVKALVSDGTEQLFRIYDIDADYPDCTVSAEHISYQTNGIIVRPFTANTAAETMAALKSSSMNSNPFTFSCSLNASGAFKCDVPASIKSQFEEVLKVFGGELYYDNYSISLMEQRGQKRNVTLRYGKNIVSIKQDQNIEDTYSAVVGYWKGHVNETDQTVTGSIISTDSPIPHERILVVDVSSDIQTADNTAATVSQVDAAVQNYIEKNQPGIPKVSLEIDMAALWQTEEYKDLAPIEKVELGDTVTVIFEKLGISEDTRAVKIEWDVLNERNSSVTFGEVERTYADDMEDQQQATADAQESADAANDNANDVRDSLNKNVSDININIGTIEEEQQGMKASIEANAEKIQTQVEKTEAIAGEQETMKSTITQQADQISSRVEKGRIISEINQSPESVTINADRITLAGNTQFVSLQNSVNSAQNTANNAANAASNAQNTADGKLSASDLGPYGSTSIDGARITTGMISANHIDTSSLNVDTITNGAIKQNGTTIKVQEVTIGDGGVSALYGDFEDVTIYSGGLTFQTIPDHGAKSDYFLRINPRTGVVTYTTSAATE